MKRYLALWVIALPLFLVVSARADCFLVDGEKRDLFDGKSIDGIQVEKKSLTILNREFPNLNVVEKTFKGELQTCTNCSGKYVSCTPPKS